MIVWEMRYFKRVFLNKLWEIHVNILILIIYMISNQKDNFLYEKCWEVNLYVKVTEKPITDFYYDVPQTA